MALVTSVSVYSKFLCTYIYSNRYNFYSFLALNSSHMISEVPNLNSTFVLMLTIIILTGDVVEACSAHASMRIHVHMYVYYSVKFS